MGRSVETVGENVIYFDCHEYDEFEFDDLIDNLICDLTAKYKSFAQVWMNFVPYPYRENRILVENSLVQVSISEYCGCGAVSVFVSKGLRYFVPEALAEHWLEQVFPDIAKIVGGYVKVIRRVGRFSNGINVYEAV